MARSARHQQAIDKRRMTLKLNVKPRHGDRAPVSWWLDLDREAFSRQAEAEKARMAPNSGIAGDKGVTY